MIGESDEKPQYHEGLLALRKPLSCALFFLVLLFKGMSVGAVDEPPGYRTENYDAPVPESLTGAKRVSAIELRELQQDNKIIVIDVMPQVRKPESLPDNQLWFPVPHQGIKGALWLPDVGYGVLSEATESWFKSQLQAATQNDKDRSLAFYCRMDCWMSWNAAKRALEFGYTSVFWFADGIEDWQFEGFEIEVLTAAEGLRQAD